jgi:hypothetical protein
MIIFCNLVPSGRLISEEKKKKGKIAKAGNLPWRPSFFYRIYTKITNLYRVHPMIVIALLTCLTQWDID